jgi:hypothetical protein
MLRVVVIGPSQGQYKEVDAAEAITPGHVVMENAAGKGIKNTLAGSALATVNVAVENDIFGKGIDDPYAVNDRLIYQTLNAGHEFMGLAPAGTGAIAYNDPVTTDAAGGIVLGTAANMIGRARTPVGAGTVAPTRIRVVVGK